MSGEDGVTGEHGSADERGVTRGDGTEARQFRLDVLAGLGAYPKTLPSKYLYDPRGAALFDEICNLAEYYPTRTELTIMGEVANEIAACVGPRAVVIEPGAGNGDKAALLLEMLDDPAACVLMDISHDYVIDGAARLQAAFPEVAVLAVHADFAAEFESPVIGREAGRRLIYFPGSTIGNFSPDEGERLLERMAHTAGPGGGLLIGVDLRKDESILLDAYDDAKGVTAAFNLNLLRRLRDELGAEVDPAGFTHRAIYNRDAGRIEMHLVSRRDQEIVIGEARIRFAEGETIHTENSYKFEIDGFQALARRAGFTPREVWTDRQDRFSVHFLECEG